MTHLRIEQAVGLTEYVSNSVVEKLYEIVTNSTLDNSSNLQGTVHINIGYRTHINSITTAYPDFHVVTDAYAIPFEDPNIAAYLNSIGIGSNGMVTEDLAVATTIVANSANTTVIKFNELRYFTNITQSRGGWTGNSSGFVRFAGWTALEEVDISNFTSLGHNNGSGYEDTFANCSSLKTVIASDKLDRIGHNAFYNCQNLETISGLSGNIQLANGVFCRCTMLDGDCLSECTFKIADGGSLFGYTKNIDLISFDTTTTNVSYNIFEQSNIQSISGLSNVTTIGSYAFDSCGQLTTIDIDLNKIISVGPRAFNDCILLFYDLNLSMLNCISISDGGFNRCPVSSINLPSLLSLGTWVFANNSRLTSVIDLGSISALPNDTFLSCNHLLSITIPSTVTRIGNKCFEGCSSLTSITIPHSVTEIGNNALKNTGIVSITIPNSVTSIGVDAFTGSLLASITFENNSSLTYIGGGAFNSCKISSIELPDSVETIDSNCFYFCRNLGSVTIGTGILTMRYPFTNYMSDSVGGFTLTMKATTPPTFDLNTNERITNPTVIYVPAASVNAYKTADTWSRYASVILAISS